MKITKHTLAVLAATDAPAGISTTECATLLGIHQSGVWNTLKQLADDGEVVRHVISARHIRWIKAGVQFMAPLPPTASKAEQERMDAVRQRLKPQVVNYSANRRAMYHRPSASAAVVGMETAPRTYCTPIPDGSRLGGFAPADTPQHHICARPGAFAFKAINSKGFA